MCCNVLQCVAVCCSVCVCVLQKPLRLLLPIPILRLEVAVCCNVLQCGAVCCSVLQCVAEWFSVCVHVAEASAALAAIPNFFLEVAVCVCVCASVCLCLCV